jgi:hypothetical protein
MAIVSAILVFWITTAAAGVIRGPGSETTILPQLTVPHVMTPATTLHRTSKPFRRQNEQGNKHVPDAFNGALAYN